MYLTYGVWRVLVFVGAGMMLIGVFEVPTVSLAVIAGVVGGSIAPSLPRPPAGGVPAPPTAAPGPEPGPSVAAWCVSDG